MSPPPTGGSNGRHQRQQEAVSSMESGGDVSGAATKRFTWKGPVIVLGKEPDPDPWRLRFRSGAVDEISLFLPLLRFHPVFELLESIAFSGVALNLVVYLATVLHGSTAFNAAHVDTWNGTTFVVPVIGAFLADSYWGKYRTILASIVFYLVVSVSGVGGQVIYCVRFRIECLPDTH